jgi:crotonobetainyl-CoA:carnitine CoA-transferase CaiB-like acyl-CoA transferase
MSEKPTHILDGYKVLDFSQVLAGPTVTRLMAEMGAEVMKIELPPGGDRSRYLPYLHDGRSGYFVQQNRGKKSLCVDLKNPVGYAIVRDLVTAVDVMVENFAPGVITRNGLGYETVSELNPRLVMCSISLCGQAGPSAYKPGFDHIGASLGRSARYDRRGRWSTAPQHDGYR